MVFDLAHLARGPQKYIRSCGAGQNPEQRLEQERELRSVIIYQTKCLRFHWPQDTL